LENEPHFSTAAINVLILMPAAPVLCCVRRYLRQDPIQQRELPIRKSPQRTLDLIPFMEHDHFLQIPSSILLLVV
jgi:hypothetical protein